MQKYFKMEFLSKFKLIASRIDFDAITLPETRIILFDFIDAFVAKNEKFTENIENFELHVKGAKDAINGKIPPAEIENLRVQLLEEQDKAVGRKKHVLALIAMTLGSGDWKDYDLGAGECFSIFGWNLFLINQSLSNVFLDFINSHFLVAKFKV